MCTRVCVRMHFYFEQENNSQWVSCLKNIFWISPQKYHLAAWKRSCTFQSMFLQLNFPYFSNLLVWPVMSQITYPWCYCFIIKIISLWWELQLNHWRSSHWVLIISHNAASQLHFKPGVYGSRRGIRVWAVLTSQPHHFFQLEAHLCWEAPRFGNWFSWGNLVSINVSVGKIP